MYRKENSPIVDKNEIENKLISSDERDNEAFEDFHDLVEAEGLGVDHNLDISDLEKQRMDSKLNRFYESNQVSTNKNHLTGHVEEYYISGAKFHEQYHTFQNFGHAQDPTSNRGGNIVQAEQYRKVNYAQEAHGPKTKETMEYKQNLRKKRKKAGEAGEANFLGPWAFYEGEEDFRIQKVVQTEEQEKLEEKFENKRQQKLEEKQREDTNINPYKKESDNEGEEEKETTDKDAAVKSYTIFHGNVSIDKSQGKSFLNPPDYLKPGEHS